MMMDLWPKILSLFHLPQLQPDLSVSNISIFICELQHLQPVNPSINADCILLNL